VSVRSRREFVFTGIASVVGIWWGVDGRASDGDRDNRQAEVLAPTAGCADGIAPPTSRSVQGPFYKAQTPRRRQLRVSGVRGQPLRLAGRVLDTNCRPLPGAVLDFWQADGDGKYDNQGMRLRGHQFADAEGHYWLETVRPGTYGAGFFERTPHLHLKAQSPTGPVLTTQLYFPDASQRNARDGLYRDELLVQLLPATGNVVEARFDLVLRSSF